MRFYQVDGGWWCLDCGKLAAFREASSVTLDDVAKHCGVTRQAAHHWENGVSAPRKRAACRLIRKWGNELKACGALRETEFKGEA